MLFSGDWTHGDRAVTASGDDRETVDLYAKMSLINEIQNNIAFSLRDHHR